jgi:hypothetical protein
MGEPGLLAGQPELLVAFLVIARRLGAPTEGDNMQGLDFLLATTRRVAVLLRHDDVQRLITRRIVGPIRPGE